MSPRSDASDQDSCFQVDSGIGAVTIIEEFIGSHERFWPLRAAVNPSVQRRTYGARTVPYGVTAFRGRCP